MILRVAFALEIVAMLGTSRLAKRGAIWISGFLVPSRRIVLLLVVEFVEKSAIYAHRVALWDSALPNTFKGFIKFLVVSTRLYFANKGDVLTIGKYEHKVLVCCRKDVVDRIQSAINDLDVFHTCIGPIAGAGIQRS
jgi:hypothetical protein